MKKKKNIKIKNIIILLFTIYIIVSLIKQRIVMNKLRDQSARLNQEIESLEVDLKILNQEIQNSGSIEFIEKVAREDLGMVKPKEIIYIDKNREKDSINQ